MSIYSIVTHQLTAKININGQREVKNYKTITELILFDFLQE